MIEGISVHRLDDGNIVGDFGEVGQQFRKFGSRLAMSRELELWAQQRGTGIDECGAVAFHQFGRRDFAIPFGQFGFVIEEFQMAGRAGHKEKNDAFGLWWEMRQLGRQWIGAGGLRSPAVLAKQLSQRNRP